MLGTDERQRGDEGTVVTCSQSLANHAARGRIMLHYIFFVSSSLVRYSVVASATHDNASQKVLTRR